MHKNLIESLCNIYSILYGILFLHVYKLFLFSTSLSIYTYTLSAVLFFSKINTNLLTLLNNFLRFTFILMPLLLIELLVVLYYGKSYQVFIEAFLFFLFTGDFIILIELTVLPIPIIKVMQFFVSFKNRICNAKQTMQQLYALPYDKLVDVLLRMGATLVALSFEAMLYNFITLVAILLYIILSAIVIFLERERDIMKNFLSSIPPLGILIALRGSCKH